MNEPVPISPSWCPKCRGRMKVFTTRALTAKTIRVRQCSRPGCGHRIRTEERVVSANAPARPLRRKPEQPAA